MNVLSLFDGISCGQVALQRAGIQVDKYLASEIKPHTIKITQKNFPNTIQLGDVCQIDFKSLQGKVDLLIGGSPCQSLSIVQSKTRQDLDGKSKLFFEFVRALQEVQPKYFLLENVASMKDECKDIISSYMGVQPVLINSNHFSAQDRPRYYWTNIPFDHKLPTCNLVLKNILEPEVDEKYYYAQEFDYLGDKQVCATIHLNGHDIIKRVHSPNYKCHTLTAVCGGNQQKKVLVNGRVRKLAPLEYERLQTLPDNYTSCCSDSQRYNVCSDGWTVDVIAHILRGLHE